jgi:TRAP transporter TAXI family solute receptor
MFKTLFLLISVMCLNGKAFITLDETVTIGYRVNQSEQRKVAKEICKLFNKEHTTIQCKTKPYFSSESIATDLNKGNIQFALLRGNFAIRQSNLNTVFSLYDEYLTVISKDDRINTLSELKDTKVGIFSGVRGAVYDVIQHEKGKNVDLNIEILNSYSDVESALYNNQIYAFITTTTHPNQKIYNLVKKGYKLNTIDSYAVNNMIKKHKYYHEADIPKDMYYTEKSINTVGIGVDFVTIASQQDKYVKMFLTAVFNNFPKFKLSNPALLSFTPKDMFERNTLPLHKESKAWVMKWKGGNMGNKKIKEPSLYLN